MSPRLAETSSFRSSAVSGVLYWIAKLSDPRELVTENCRLSLDRATLLLHVLEVDDADAIAAYVKSGYERPLMEIFEA